jgi:hypothetical protein
VARLPPPRLRFTAPFLATSKEWLASHLSVVDPPPPPSPEEDTPRIMAPAQRGHAKQLMAVVVYWTSDGDGAAAASNASPPRAPSLKAALTTVTCGLLWRHVPAARHFRGHEAAAPVDIAADVCTAKEEVDAIFFSNAGARAVRRTGGV